MDGGHDIFGQNILFFPRNTWENLLSTIEDYKEDAKSYETTFNEIISAVMEKDNFQQVSNPKPYRHGRSFFSFFFGEGGRGGGGGLLLGYT